LPARAAKRHDGEIHAYVLMTNPVHLLVTPRKPLAIAKLMQSVGRHYVRYVNDYLWVQSLLPTIKSFSTILRP
jgi:REP element-mobilizing transposase RayT